MLLQEKFNNKYRIKSARLQYYDYGQNGAYFVTICTKNRKMFYGKIINKQVKLSNLGKVATKYWSEIPSHFPFVSLGEYVIMPNHIHGIIFINKSDDIVETQNLASLRKRQNSENIFGPQSKNLASVIRGYKTAVTKYARKHTKITDVWQSRFYDHIIRNEKELLQISKYIKGNPINWGKDDYFVEN